MTLVSSAAVHAETRTMRTIDLRFDPAFTIFISAFSGRDLSSMPVVAWEYVQSDIPF